MKTNWILNAGGIGRLARGRPFGTEALARLVGSKFAVRGFEEVHPTRPSVFLKRVPDCTQRCIAPVQREYEIEVLVARQAVANEQEARPTAEAVLMWPMGRAA